MVLLVIHVGAGNHDVCKRSLFHRLLQKALNAGVHGLIIDAADIVENLPLCNTGYGSLLNLMGEVECDASFITVEHRNLDDVAGLLNRPQWWLAGTPVAVGNNNNSPMSLSSEDNGIHEFATFNDSATNTTTFSTPPQPTSIVPPSTTRQHPGGYLQPTPLPAHLFMDPAPLPTGTAVVDGTNHVPLDLLLTQPQYKRGALVGIDDCKTPIRAALAVFNAIEASYTEKGLFDIGITMPIALNYKSMNPTESYAAAVPRCRPEELILKPAYNFYRQYKKQVVGMSNEVCDTIGLVELADTPEGATALVVTSSGGNFFKVPGRIGCAGELGSAIEVAVRGPLEIICSCSGNGEDIMIMKLAHYVANRMLDVPDVYPEDLVDVVLRHAANNSLQARNSRHESIIYIGVLLTIRNLQTGEVRLLYCHLTELFYFGYSSQVPGSDPKPRVVLSRLENLERAGKLWAMGEVKL